MSVVTSLTRLARTDSKWYLFVGVLSLLKAVAVRHNSRRLRRELLDAALFLSLGLLLRTVERRGASKRKTKSSEARAKAGSKVEQVRSATESIRGRLPGREPEPESRVAALRRRLSRS